MELGRRIWDGKHSRLEPLGLESGRRWKSARSCMMWCFLMYVCICMYVYTRILDEGVELAVYQK